MSTAPSQAIATDKLVRVLCQSLALELAFLEMCDEDELHPDVAVKRMENIANELGELSAAELDIFFVHVRALADEQRRFRSRLLRRLGRNDERVCESLWRRQRFGLAESLRAFTELSRT